MGRIALIDDHADSLELFTLILTGDHEIVPFIDGERFLKEFFPGSFDLILMDIAMPSLDGFELFRRIQKDDPDVPVVAVTAMAEPQQKERALKAGFCDYFVKPILEIDRFRQAVHSHVGRCSNPRYKGSA